MSTVKDNDRLFRAKFKPCGESCCRNSFNKMLVLYYKMLFPKNAYRRINGKKVVYLVFSAKGKRKFGLSNQNIHSGNVF